MKAALLECVVFIIYGHMSLSAKPDFVKRCIVSHGAVLLLLKYALHTMQVAIAEVNFPASGHYPFKCVPLHCMHLLISPPPVALFASSHEMFFLGQATAICPMTLQ